MHVFAKQTCAVGFGGGVVRLKRGAVWAAEDPLVTARPELFSDEPVILHSSGPGKPPVEEATAVPGEKRPRKR
jgi:hypothetical protein